MYYWVIEINYQCWSTYVLRSSEIKLVTTILWDHWYALFWLHVTLSMGFKSESSLKWQGWDLIRLPVACRARRLPLSHTGVTGQTYPPYQRYVWPDVRQFKRMAMDAILRLLCYLLVRITPLLQSNRIPRVLGYLGPSIGNLSKVDYINTF